MERGVFQRSSMMWICESTSLWNLYSYHTLLKVFSFSPFFSIDSLIFLQFSLVIGYRNPSSPSPSIIFLHLLLSSSSPSLTKTHHLGRIHPTPNPSQTSHLLSSSTTIGSNPSLSHDCPTSSPPYFPHSNLIQYNHSLHYPNTPTHPTQQLNHSFYQNHTSQPPKHIKSSISISFPITQITEPFLIFLTLSSPTKSQNPGHIHP